jgi:hypothetical protein
MSYTFEELFNYEALKGFNLSVNTFIYHYQNVDEIIGDFINDKIIDLKNKIIIMCNNPEFLTIKDKQNIHNINKFLKKNSGRTLGYYNQRKKKTELVIEEYKNIVLENRMFMIANMEQLFKEIDRLILSFSVIDEKKKNDYKEIRKQDIKDWQKKYYTCDCGETLQQVSRARHERTQTHQDSILLKNNPREKENIVMTFEELF